MPALTALYSPTVNSYKRYVPGVWAPLTATLGHRESHVRDPRHPRRREGDAARVPADRGRHQPVHRDRDVPRGGPLGHRERRSSRRRRRRATRRRTPTSRACACRARCARPRTVCRAAPRPRASSAPPSSITTCARASGKCASTSARSRSGSSAATSRRCDDFERRVTTARALEEHERAREPERA